MDPLRRPKAPPFAFPRARELHFQGLGEGPAPHDCLVARSGLMWTGGEEGLACDFGRVRRFEQSRLGTRWESHALRWPDPPFSHEVRGSSKAKTD